MTVSPVLMPIAGRVGNPTAGEGVGDLPALPAGLAYLIDANGAYETDANGAYLIGAV